MRVVELFAGMRGWGTAARTFGTEPLGIELDPVACATSEAAGFPTLCADIATLDPADFPCDGLIASPPCPDFSTAGNGAGRTGKSGRLVDEVMRWAILANPRWIVCEQVAPVLPIWEEFAYRLGNLGYFTDARMADAADFGVPQNRRRAILRASRSGPLPPLEVTHHHTPGMFGGEPWVTMAEAVGLPSGCRYQSGQNSRAPGGTVVRYVRSCDRPAGTLTTKTTTQWVIEGAGDRRKLTAADSLTLQGFDPAMTVCGTGEERNRQIGNAIPPALAAAVLAQAITYEAAA